MNAYYNEIDPYCCEWLKALMEENLIPAGVVDSRPIQEVEPKDLDGFTQCHFFAGLGGWPYAARLAGWPDYRDLWTGSCPCQPFSLAGKQQGFDDTRHLWPHYFRLIRARRPACVMGEQVAAAPGYAWLDGVGADLDSEDYAWRPVDIPACSVNAPQIRNRLYWLAHCNDTRLEGWPGQRTDSRSQRAATERNGDVGSGMDDTTVSRLSKAESGESGAIRDGAWRRESERRSSITGFWDDYELIGPDPKGKYRRVKPGVRLLDSGIPSRVAKLRALGNSIVPQEAAEVIAAWMEVSA